MSGRGVLILVVALAGVSIGNAEVVIETVTVRNSGNPMDTRYPDGGVDGFGGVDYVYNIGKYEVTAGQYAEFLNAVAATDTYGLYNASMATFTYHLYGCKIQQDCSSGSCSYSVDSAWANRPVNYVSWGDAARFANWLHNGQPTGAQDLTTTEDGPYYLNGATSDEDLLAVTREDEATWVIPSEDEWYKAAYHYNDGVTGNYFDYPTGTDSAPWNDLLDRDPGNNATFFDNGHYTIGHPYWRTEVGAHENSDSPYGTFDQGGNVWEWNEAVRGSDRGLRAGSFNGSYPAILRAVYRWSRHPSCEFSGFGFRVANKVACGNGTIEDSEECDDGGDSDTCDADCTVAECGDGTLNITAGEDCDDGNTQAGDGCDENCQFDLGACCVGTICRIRTVPDCSDLDGSFLGLNSTCNVPDADGDRLRDECDGCPDDPDKIQPGICGCHVDDNADADGDSVPDCIDQCTGVDDTIYAPECADAIPTVSEWGVAALALLLLVVAKVVFRRRAAV